ncbi:MAG: hypothetical protein J7M19_04990 [Planctomycetes bacterium]|nr:hypothetical protein [Planctomycetota bacterium]
MRTVLVTLVVLFALSSAAAAAGEGAAAFAAEEDGSIITVTNGPVRFAVDRERPGTPSKVWYDVNGDGLFADSEVYLDSDAACGPFFETWESCLATVAPGETVVNRTDREISVSSSGKIGFSAEYQVTLTARKGSKDLFVNFRVSAPMEKGDFIKAAGIRFTAVFPAWAQMRYVFGGETLSERNIEKGEVTKLPGLPGYPWPGNTIEREVCPLNMLLQDRPNHYVVRKWMNWHNSPLEAEEGVRCAGAVAAYDFDTVGRGVLLHVDNMPAKAPAALFFARPRGVLAAYLMPPHQQGIYDRSDYNCDDGPSKAKFEKSLDITFRFFSFSIPKQKQYGWWFPYRDTILKAIYDLEKES